MGLVTCPAHLSLGKLADVYEGHLPPDSDQELNAEHTCVSCWNMNDTESAAMWSLYASKNGLAVKSSVGKLLAALSEDGPGDFTAAAVPTEHLGIAQKMLCFFFPTC